MNHQMLVLLSKRHNGASPILSQHVLALELLRLSVSKLIIDEIIAVLPSHSQFRLQNNLYLDLHGLVFETSIYHWQDQPGSDCSSIPIFDTIRLLYYYTITCTPCGTDLKPLQQQQQVRSNGITRTEVIIKDITIAIQQHLKIPQSSNIFNIHTPFTTCTHPK